MSRLAKTAEQHFLSGTRSEAGRERPDRKVASVFESGRPKFPAHISKAARKEYKRAVKFLSDRRTLSEADFFAISVFAEVYARWIFAKQELGTELIITQTIVDKKGNTSTVMAPNPLIKIVADCEAKILSYSNALGLNPGARDKIKQLKNGVDDEAIIPGSMAALNPELYVVRPLAPKIDPAEMTADDETAEAQL